MSDPDGFFDFDGDGDYDMPPLLLCPYCNDLTREGICGACQAEINEHIEASTAVTP